MFGGYLINCFEVGDRVQSLTTGDMYLIMYICVKGKVWTINPFDKTGMSLVNDTRWVKVL